MVPEAFTPPADGNRPGSVPLVPGRLGHPQAPFLRLGSSGGLQ